MKPRSKIALFALLSIAIIVLALYCTYGITTRRIRDPEAKGVTTYYYLGEMLVYKSFEKDPVKLYALNGRSQPANSTIVATTLELLATPLIWAIWIV